MSESLLHNARMEWLNDYTAAEAKAWIAAMDAAEDALYRAGIVDEFGFRVGDEIDVERLAEALWNDSRVYDGASWTEMTRRKGTISGDNYRTHAARLVREYAALAEPRP